MSPDLEDAEAGSSEKQDSSGGEDGYEEDDASEYGTDEYEEDEGADDMLADDGHGLQDKENQADQPEDEPADRIEKMPGEDEAGAAPEQPEDAPPLEEPEEMILKTSANGAESLYVKDPVTGEWVNAETGGVLDYEKYKNEYVKQMESDKKFNDEQFDKISRGESAHDKALRDEMQKIADAEKQEAYTNKLKSKYGTDDLGQIQEIIEKNQERDKASFERWQDIADFNEAGEKTATVVGVVADVGVDALATVVPGGNGIKGRI